MDPRRKKTLKSLAKSFARVDQNDATIPREPWTADFVPGKGHGLIFLLREYSGCHPWSVIILSNELILGIIDGGPGVGKTCTAGESNEEPQSGTPKLGLTNNVTIECIAAFTKRPLMVLTSSDISTDPSMVEGNLTRQFKTAKSWGAVLLIDEADVFMERRSTADLVRNSLVAGQFNEIFSSSNVIKFLLKSYRFSSSTGVL